MYYVNCPSPFFHIFWFCFCSQMLISFIFNQNNTFDEILTIKISFTGIGPKVSQSAGQSFYVGKKLVLVYFCWNSNKLHLRGKIYQIYWSDVRILTHVCKKNMIINWMHRSSHFLYISVSLGSVITPTEPFWLTLIFVSFRRTS